MKRATVTHVGGTPDARPAVSSRLLAEAAGTFVLVFGVVGAALLAAAFDDGRGGLNVGFLGVAFALGLSVVVGAFAFANVSGAHFNPAVTVGLAVAGRFPWRLVGWYVIAQLSGGLAASTLVAAVAAGGPGDLLAGARASGFASTGWGELSPGHFSLLSAALIEVAATCVFVWVVLGVTSPGAPGALAPLAIGLTLTLVALVAIPVSNGSFNPARSFATAVWGGGVAMAQLWMSLAAPTVGALVAGATFRPLFGRRLRN
ncbi:aquaporin [Microbacterium timonense]|uniref:aquaporin n=1 Tax=Microbacterium timonense TaxID=2086576 RepID=UPI000D1096D2|nr:aquaporin [Microbacterium timonense]